ncbi:MAG: J domain-containing protein [Proteobacteria bacterium]|jgi:DnaJ-class molecular chaperone|uniref:DnaJ C-terminal domain-containing protein n=1 Tax=Hyphomicrobiales TaxID=356 RepID=UPI0003807073|nr:MULTISPECIES: J domain-containing protein [Phyllobacteriaceae]MCA0279295.1 J domain-containing protein [Pseudomonadota bacterium]MCX8570926.1 J domain-containing protein [Aminobacter sp. MET-1]
MRDPYEVLGVAKNASAKDIKSAFRKLAKKHHPDQNPDDPKAKERFSAANQAYEILGDEKKKASFDRGEIDAEGKPRFHGFEGAGGGDPFGGFRRQQGGPGASHFEFRQSGPGGGGSFDAGDIFSQIFGDAFGQRGGAGAGAHPGAGMGSGQRAQPGADINVSLDVTIEEAATAPKVTAQFPDGRKIAVKLPEYVEDGQTIRLKGQGEQGFGGAGDALVKIRFRLHPRYRIEGRDLHVDLPVSLKDAVLGAKAAVETPTGRLAVKVPEWSSSDKVLRIKGRGLPEKAGGHGDLYAHVRVMLPEGGDPALEELVRKFAD